MAAMGEYRSDLPERPRRFMKLPIDERGFPVPWFVAWQDGKPDFRVVRPGGIAIAHNKGLCWLCGEPRGVYSAFVIGPMCGINRVSSEPPSHRECAEYAVRACPFLTRPMAVRNSRGLPEEAQNPAGYMIERNPGVTLLWVTKSYKAFRVDADPYDPGTQAGVLFRIGEPTEVQFWARGRQATRAEVDASVESGLPLLEAPAQRQGPLAVRELARQRAAFDSILGGACPA
jgi:hypothetical protein